MIDTILTVLRVDGSVESHAVMMSATPCRTEASAAVAKYLGGRPFSRVEVVHEGAGADLFVYDEPEQLPVNPTATELYHNNVLRHCPEAKRERLPPIRGLAVVCSRRIWF